MSASKVKSHEMDEVSGDYQNVGRTMIILSLLAEASIQGVRQMDLVNKTGLGKATVHRIMSGLTVHGLADKDEATGRFFLGIKLISLAASAANRFGLAELADPVLQRICQLTQDTTYLTLRVGDEAVCIDRCEGTYPILTLTLNAGDRRPLGVGGGSLAILAFLPDEEMERIIATHGAARLRFHMEDLTLRDVIRTARDRGYVFFNSTLIPNMSSVAVPICRDDRIPIAGLSVATISERLQVARREQIAASLKEAAGEIESKLNSLLKNVPTSRIVRMSKPR
jgi:DNA-binding IclR family transcriptional regulator